MKLRLTLGLVAALLAVAAVGCGGDDDATGDVETNVPGADDGNGSEELSGTIQIDGSSTVAPLSEAAAELYMAARPNVRVTVATSGTSGGFQKFCIGETDMNDASRAIKESEVELCEENGIGYDAIQVANDALSLIVHPDNPLMCMTVDQANQIWDDGSTVQTWGDVDGLDIPSDMAGQALTLYGPGTDSGTFDFFTEAINGEEGRIRNDYRSIGEDDQAAIVGVEGDPYAMAYIPYSFVQEAGEGVKPLQIDGGEGCVDATLENVQDGSYVPLGRPLFVYASDTALSRPEVLDFMRFYLENSEEAALAATFVPLTAEQISEQSEKVEQLAQGS
jgi:phosphate transport system substrate-binding protein